jgi:hypothetical protein
VAGTSDKISPRSFSPFFLSPDAIPAALKPGHNIFFILFISLNKIKGFSHQVTKKEIFLKNPVASYGECARYCGSKPYMKGSIHLNQVWARMAELLHYF